MLSTSVWIATAAEADELATLLAELRDWREQASPTAAELARRVAEQLVSEDSEFLLASCENWEKPAGMCQLRFRPSVWSDGGHCHIEDLYVRSHARGQGVGRGLLEGALNRARARACAHVDADVDARNTRGVQLFEAAGFGPKHGSGPQLLVRRELQQAMSGRSRTTLEGTSVKSRAPISERLCRAINDHDLDRFVSYFAPSYHSEQPAHPDRTFSGPDVLRGHWSRFLKLLPDLRAELIRSARLGDVEWGEWRWFGRGQAGKPFDARGVIVLGLEEDGIGWARIYMEPIAAAEVPAR